MKEFLEQNATVYQLQIELKIVYGLFSPPHQPRLIIWRLQSIYKQEIGSNYYSPVNSSMNENEIFLPPHMPRQVTYDGHTQAEQKVFY